MGRIGKVARLLGAVGGMGVLAWAVRDRFVSIAVPREPEPPAFRTPPTSRAPAPDVDQDLTAVKGIGPVFARRLISAGLRTFADVAAATDADLAEIAGVSESRVATWRAQAKDLAGR